MRRHVIIFGLFAFVFVGCQKKITLKETALAHYSKEFAKVLPKNVIISVFVSYDSLSNWLSNRMDKTIFESETNESFIGFPIKSTLAGNFKFTSNNPWQISIQVPTFFEAKPNVAGFNAGKVQGKLQVNLDLNLQLKSINHFSLGNIQYSYSWVEKPLIKVAGFGLNVGPVLDNLLKNKSDEVLATLKSSVNGLLEPTNLEKMLVNYSKNIVWPDNILPMSSVGLGIRKFDLSSTGINLELLLNTSIGFATSKIDAKKTIYYLNNDQKIGRELPFSGQLDWIMVSELLTKLAQEKLKNQGLKIHINGEGREYLRAHINGFKGPKSELLIDFVPVVLEQHVLGFRVIHQELKGLIFPKSLFKNRVIKRINWLATEFKLDLMQSSELINQFSVPIVMNNTILKIDFLQWNESSFYVSGLLGADWKILK